MPIKLSQTVIMSDVDGTLLIGTPETSPQNLEALERYTANGGRLAIATGRSNRFIEHLVEALPVNYPCITYNGGAIYDFQTGEYLSHTFLGEQIPVKEYAKDIRRVFPGCANVFLNTDGYFDLGGVAGREFRERYKNPFLQFATDDRLGDGPYYKIVFLIDPAHGRELYEYTQSQQMKGVRFVFSDDYMLEMLPEQSSKGAAMAKLVEITGVPRENMIAIGDYFNDFEMIEYAGIGVTMSDAPKEIQDVAQMIVRPCAEHSLADLITQLESRYEY